MSVNRLPGWKRSGSGKSAIYYAYCNQNESELLRSIVTAICDLLTERANSVPYDYLSTITDIQLGHSFAPTDATLGRLLPDFHRPENYVDIGNDTVTGDLNGALRSVNEPLIIKEKLAAAHCLLASIPEGGGEIRLTAQQADQWLIAINDVRLSLGAILEINEDTLEGFVTDHPDATHLQVYQWLTEQQWVLVEQILGSAKGQ